MARDDLPIFNLANSEHMRTARKMLEGYKGKIVTIDIHQMRDQRTLSQNSFLHGVVFVRIAAVLSDNWGMKVSMLEAKAAMKDEYLRCEIVNHETGETTGKFYTKHTADLDVKECSEFIDRLDEFYFENTGKHLPSPREYENEEVAA